LWGFGEVVHAMSDTASVCIPQGQSLISPLIVMKQSSITPLRSTISLCILKRLSQRSVSRTKYPLHVEGPLVFRLPTSGKRDHEAT
jgi:hypothetical protein